MALTDGQLVERVRSGDRDAFGDLVGRYRDMVYGLGYHLTHDFEAARDLAQEAFVQAYLKLGQLRDPDKFSGWLRQIATNVHRAHERRREVATVTLDEVGAVPDTRHLSGIEVVVRDALSRLRAPERLALTLHYINGYSHAEIGEFLGVRPETVKTRLARARQHLKTEVMAMVREGFEQNRLPEEFTKETMGRLLAELAATQDPFTPAGLRRLAKASSDPQITQLATDLGELLDHGETFERAFLLTGSLSSGADCFVRFARLTGRREGFTIAAQLLESGLLQPESPVSADDVADFCAYLSCIFQAGIPIFQAFGMAGRRFPLLADLASEMESDIREHNTMVGAFARRRTIFTEPFVGAIGLLEATGHLDDGLAVLAALLWEPWLLDTSKVSGKWEERMERARRYLRQTQEQQPNET